jgi:hypothetical protein
VRRPAREGATVARYGAPGVRRPRAEAGFDRQLIGLFTISLRRRKQVDAHPRRRQLRLDASFAALAPTAPASVMMMESVVANNNEPMELVRCSSLD